MHQSPQKQFAGRRAKFAELDLVDADNDAEAERRLYRATQPKARKFSPRDEAAREGRWDEDRPK